MKVIITIALISMFTGSMAQTGTITLKGVLTAKNGDALTGCNVVLKGKMMEASTTQECGDFEISIPDNYEGVLVFTCLAPRTWEIELKRLKGMEDIVIVFTDWDAFEDGPCKENFKKKKRIKIN